MWNKLLDLDTLQEYSREAQQFCLQRGCDIENCYECQYYNQIWEGQFSNMLIEVCDLPEDLGE